MSVQILVSTMFQEDFKLIDAMKINSNAIIINQTNENRIINIDKLENQILWINSTDRGLSRSRNTAIINSTAEICILADDDLIYREGYSEIVNRYFIENPTVDIITFQVEGIDGKFKDYPKESKNLGYLGSMKISSVEVAFRRKSIIKAGVLFNEQFGSGSDYLMGEENIFLFDCLKKGLKIKYIPEKIAYLYIGESTWFKGYNEKYFLDRGAVFQAMSSKLVIPFIIQFALRRRFTYKEKYSIFTVLRFMLKGRKKYLTTSQ